MDSVPLKASGLVDAGGPAGSVSESSIVYPVEVNVIQTDQSVAIGDIHNTRVKLWRGTC